jgi:hypothetical protein
MTQSIPLAADARERFLVEIAKVVPAARIDELHLFPPIRQGPLETGVAVVAAWPTEPTEPTEPAEPAEPADAAVRHVIYSARYRWTRKGPDRGKWESEVVAEADAPLVTVEAVVQGVKMRAEEAFDPERVAGDEARVMIADAERRCLTTP